MGDASGGGFASHTSYERFSDGSPKRTTHANGTLTDYAYDNAQRLTDVWHQFGAATLSRQTYTVNALGNRTQAAEHLAQLTGGPTSATFTYGYDRLSRLTTVAAPSGATGYSYDPVGNRLTRTRGTPDSYALWRGGGLPQRWASAASDGLLGNGW